MISFAETAGVILFRLTDRILWRIICLSASRSGYYTRKLNMKRSTWASGKG